MTESTIADVSQHDDPPPPAATPSDRSTRSGAPGESTDSLKPTTPTSAASPADDDAGAGAGATDAAARDGDALGPRRARRAAQVNRSPLRFLEPVAVLLAPLVMFLVYRPRPMALVQSIDPTLYTAFIENGPDIIERYGVENYFWSRAGLVIPARLLYLTLGPVTGFFTFRYLLVLAAIGPAYLLFRRHWGPLAGAVAAAVILVNPVIVDGLGSDYPNGIATAYLIGGACCLFMPAQGRARWVWVAGAGVLFTAAVNCNVVAAMLVGTTVLAYTVFHVWRRWLSTLGEMVLLAVAFVATTFAFMVASELLFGQFNIIKPTLDALDKAQGGAFGSFHSTTNRWFPQETQLFVPPVLVLGWVAARAFGMKISAGRVEWAVVSAVVLQSALFAYLQFVSEGSTLENYMYSSMLWGQLSLLLALTIVAIWQPDHDRLRGHLVSLAVVLAVPWLFHLLATDLMFRSTPWWVILAVLAAVCGTLARRAAPTRAPGAVFVVSAAVIVLVAGTFALIVGRAPQHSLFPGQAIHPQPSFTHVFFNPGDEQVDAYRVISDFADDLPDEDDEPGPLRMWWPTLSSDLVSRAGGMQLWLPNTVMAFDPAAGGLPALSAKQRDELESGDTRFIVLMGDTDEEFATATEALDDAGLDPRSAWTRTYRSGPLALHAELIELGVFDDETPEPDGGSS